MPAARRSRSANRHRAAIAEAGGPAADGPAAAATADAGAISGGRTAWTLSGIDPGDAVAIEVVDGYGNAGSVDLVSD